NARSPVAPKKTRASEWGSLIRVSPFHRYFAAGFSRCPPNWKRMAESNLSWKSASPREVKRSYSAVVSTGTGTASSIAALIVHRGRRGQVQQPRGDDAAAPPHLRDVAQVEVVLVEFGVAQGRRLGVDLVRLLADIGVAQDGQPLGVGGHNAVFDPVVDHLDE